MRALHRYRRGHGFDSRSSLNFFQVSSFQLLKLKHPHCDDLHIILSLSAVQIYDYFIYSCSFLHLRDKYELSIDQLPVGLIAQLVRALHRYRRGHGFNSRSSLNFFQVSSFQLLKLKHPHCDDLHIILSLSAVQIYDYFIYSCSFLHLRHKYEFSIDQLPVGLIAQLVRALHWYRGGHGFDSRSSLNFFQVSSFQLLELKHLHCEDLHIILSLSAVQIYDYFIYSCLL